MKFQLHWMRIHCPCLHRQRCFFITFPVYRSCSRIIFREGVQLIHRRIESLVAPVENDLQAGPSSLGIGDARRGSVLEEAKRAEIPCRANVCVIDPEWIDEGLLGRRLLPILAHAKQSLLSAQPKFIPAAAGMGSHR